MCEIILNHVQTTQTSCAKLWANSFKVRIFKVSQIRRKRQYCAQEYLALVIKTQHILKQMNASISIQMLEIIQYYVLHAFNTLLFRACSNSFWARIVIIRKAEHSGNPSLFVCLHILLKHNYTTQLGLLVSIVLACRGMRLTSGLR